MLQPVHLLSLIMVFLVLFFEKRLHLCDFCFRKHLGSLIISWQAFWQVSLKKIMLRNFMFQNCGVINKKRRKSSWTFGQKSASPLILKLCEESLSYASRSFCFLLYKEKKVLVSWKFLTLRFLKYLHDLECPESDMTISRKCLSCVSLTKILWQV